MKCFAYLPRCIGGKKKDRESKPSKANDDKDHVHRKLTDYFSDKELIVLGDLAHRVRVVIDSTLPDTLHGTSRVTFGVPLAVVNPRAPDRRYVILHELMHHQLDELGCPSLCCTVKGVEPVNSWLRQTKFQSFVRGLLVQLWELVQHSRFNIMLKRVFDCGPESARDGEYRRYIQQTALPMYGMCGQNGDRSVRRVAIAAHVATCMLEASADVQQEFTTFLKQKFAHGDKIIELGEKLVSHVRSVDIELLKCSREDLDKLMSSMLEDLQKMLTELNTGMFVMVGPVQPLKEKFNNRCSTVAEIDFCSPTPMVNVTAGGFGAHFGTDEESGGSVEGLKEQEVMAAARAQKELYPRIKIGGYRYGCACACCDMSGVRLVACGEDAD